MNPRLINCAETPDGAHQLTFQASLVVELLRKVGDAEVASIEDLHADHPDTAAVWQTGAGELQAEVRSLLIRNPDR